MLSAREPPAGTGNLPLLVYAFEDFEFDEGRWELRKGGVPLEVPPKVMQTLAMLIRHRDRVVPNEELLGTLWYQVAVTEASLLKSIRMARKVLGDDGESQRFIRTTRGRGYRFIPPVRETRASEASHEVPGGRREPPREP